MRLPGTTYGRRDRPVLISLFGTFLPRGMPHIYRQVCEVEGFDHWVVTRRRKNERAYPFPRVVALRRSVLRGLSRFWCRWQRRRMPFLPSEVRQILWFSCQRRADVVHVYLGNVAAQLFDYLAREQAARIVSFHGGDLSDHITPAEYRRLSTHADLFLVRSESLRAALEQRGIPPERIRLNPTGVPIPTGFVAKTAPSPGQPVRVLQACRLIAKKGLDVSMKGVHRLVQTGRNVTLDLAGAGPEGRSLRMLAAELGIAQRVRFLGFLDNSALLRSLPDYDVFVHPSRTTSCGDREGIPNSLLEAMANGVPVVATRHSGIPEAITDERDGLLIDRAEPGALARAVQRLLDCPQLYANISRAAHETVAARFSLAVSSRLLETAYREAAVLAETRHRSPLRLRRAA